MASVDNEAYVNQLADLGDVLLWRGCLGSFSKMKEARRRKPRNQES